VKKGIKDPEEIKRIVIDIAGKLDINLNVNRIDDLSGLMQRISKLDLNTEQITNQLKDIGQKLDDTIKNNEQVQTLLQKILSAIKEFFISIFKAYFSIDHNVSIHGNTACSVTKLKSLCTYSL